MTTSGELIDGKDGNTPSGTVLPAFAFDRSWWKESIAFATSRWKVFLLPSVAFTMSNMLAVGADFLIANAFKGEELDLSRLAVCGVGALGICIVALCFAFWALGRWFVNLLAFCREWFALQAGKTTPFEEILKKLKADKSYLSSLMLWNSVYLLVPVLPLSVLIGLNVVASPKFMFLGQRMMEFSPPVSICINVTIAVLSIFTVASTFIPVALAACSDAESGLEVTKKSIGILWKHLGASLMVSLVVTCANVLLTAPLTLLSCTPWAEQVASNVPLNLVAQVWLGITSVVLWPLSLLPFCQIVKDSGASPEQAPPSAV